MKNIKTIISKELFRFFKDIRIVITTLILPGLLIFTLYSLMGPAITSSFTPDKEYVGTVYVANYPESVEAVFEAGELNVNITEIENSEIDAKKELVVAGEAELVVVFPNDFDTDVIGYDPSSGLAAPHIEMYYNSSKTESMNLYNIFLSILDVYESSMANKFDVNLPGGDFDLADEKDVMGMVLSMLLPFLIITFLFSGCMAVAPESIAGEKERGTIATLLVTTIKRSELAIGKIISLSIIATLSALSSFLGTMLSFPKMMGPEMDGVNAIAYGVLDYVALLFVIMSTVLVLITLVSIISAFAKTVKEATTLVMPLMIAIFLVGLTAMFAGASSQAILYLIPIYNSVHVMANIFSYNFNLLHFLITIISNIMWTGLLVFLLTKMFNSEKIMFSK
ncbi:MAG: ABC transporter permease [Bacilli bacterium]|jgi:sodium transport system permease protein